MKIYCVMNGLERTDLENVMYASTSENAADFFAHTFGFYNSNGDANIKVLDVAEYSVDIHNEVRSMIIEVDKESEEEINAHNE